MKLPNPEEILTSEPYSFSASDLSYLRTWPIYKAMKEYGIQMYNAALELAAKNVELEFYKVEGCEVETHSIRIDQESILRLKLSKNVNTR